MSPEVQLRLARLNAPAAAFICADFAELDLPERSFDGITALYSISHIPRDEHQRCSSGLGAAKPGGLFLASLGAAASSDWTGEWLGVPMFFSSHDADTNRQHAPRRTTNLINEEVISMQEPEGEVAFLWALAQKPAQ